MPHAARWSCYWNYVWLIYYQTLTNERAVGFPGMNSPITRRARARRTPADRRVRSRSNYEIDLDLYPSLQVQPGHCAYGTPYGVHSGAHMHASSRVRWYRTTRESCLTSPLGGGRNVVAAALLGPAPLSVSRSSRSERCLDRWQTVSLTI